MTYLCDDGTGRYRPPTRSQNSVPINPAARFGAVMTFLVKLAAVGSVILVGLSVYPGVWVDLLFISILLFPLWLPALGTVVLIVLFFRARSARMKPLEPDLDLGVEDLGVGKGGVPHGRPILFPSFVLILCLVL